MARDHHMIIAVMRTGSTTLNMAMAELDGVRSASEPFKGEGVWGDIECKKEITHLLQHYNGYKEVIWRYVKKHHILEFDYPIPKVVLLRRNILQKVVSEHIAEETKYWVHKGYEKVTGPLNVLDVEEARNMLQIYTDLDDKMTGLANERGIPVVYYEDFFETTDVDERLAKFAKLLEHFQYDPMSEEEYEREKVVFAPSNKSNSIDTYRRIPNIDEIESELGCDETGFLFKNTPEVVVNEGGLTLEQRRGIWQRMSYCWRDKTGVYLHVRGDKYHSGTDGHEQSHEKAFADWLKGAEHGNIQCMRNVSWAYKSGVGTEANLKASAEWLTKVEEYTSEEGDVPIFVPQVIVGDPVQIKQRKWLDG